MADHWVVDATLMASSTHRLVRVTSKILQMLRCVADLRYVALVRISLTCRRLGGAPAPVFTIHIRSIEASLQDRALKLLEGCSVRLARVPPVPRSCPDGSQLSRVGSAVAAHKEVEPDESPV